MFPVLFLAAALNAQTFEWETATTVGETVIETISGITVTASEDDPGGGRSIILIAPGGYGGSTGNLVMAEVNNIVEVIFTFSEAVNIMSIYAVEASGDQAGTWTYTPTGGSNTTVIDNISAGQGHTVTLNWTNVNSFTVTKPTEYGNGGLAFDEIILGAAATAPTCTTSTASSVTTTSADLGGNVTDDGGATVTERSVVYSSTDSTPEIGEAGVTKDSNGSGTGPFSETISGLTYGTRYWFRAYAINSAGTSYGTAERCTTLVEITLIHGANAALNFQQANASPPESNWLCGQFSLNKPASSYGYLTSVTVTIGGTYDAGDLLATPFQLYTNTTNSFSSASSVGSSQADPGSGNDVTFSGFTQYLSTGMNYFWVTADISATATADDNMNATIDAAGDLSFLSGTLSGSSSYGKLNAGSDASLPVELSQFSAEALQDGILLKWSTESEVNNLGFILERSVKTQDLASPQWNIIASYQTHDALKGQGNTSAGTDYQFTDENIQPGETCSYRLSDVDI